MLGSRVFPSALFPRLESNLDFRGRQLCYSPPSPVLRFLRTRPLHCFFALLQAPASPHNDGNSCPSRSSQTHISQCGFTQISLSKIRGGVDNLPTLRVICEKQARKCIRADLKLKLSDVLTYRSSNRGIMCRLGRGETRLYDEIPRPETDPLREGDVVDGCHMATRLLGDLLEVEVGRSSKRTSLGDGRGGT